MTARPRFVVFAALLVLCLGVGSARAAEGGKVALLVGIGEYPFIRDPNLQLHGAKTDVEQMGLVLQYCGFEITVLEGKAATSAAIRKALRALADQAGSKGEVVFYFSGRGSVAYDPKRPGVKQDLEPTLVPYDGQAQSAAADLPMSVLENWAREVTAKQASVTILLDASYLAPKVPRGEDRFYKDVPRCVSREGRPRAALYNGPGVLLAATDTMGRAYEWRVDFASDTWAGAFTDLWTNAAMRRLRAGNPPTHAELMEDLRNFFAARRGYMPGTRPYPAADGMADARYRRPVFAQTGTAVPPPAPVAAKIETVVEKREEQEKTLRVALEASVPARGETNDLKPFEEYARKRLDRVAILPQYGDRPDRILAVTRSGDGWEVVVRGDEVDAARRPTFRGRDVVAVMEAGLANYLQRQSYALRLYRLAEPVENARPDWKIRAEKPSYRPGDPFAYHVETPRAGFLYIFDRDEKDAVVQMIFPLQQEPDNRVPAGVTRLPRRIAFRIPEGLAGRTHTRALFVDPSLKLPPLPEGAADPAAYAKAERDHLRALIQALERKKATWSALDFHYDIAP